MAPKARVQKRLYYKIGEACKALDIQPYVLRYWETEFPALSPSKSRSGQRVYSEKELGIIRRIKELLYGEGYTIAGAKKKLEAELANGSLGGTEEGEGEPGAGPETANEPPAGKADTDTEVELAPLPAARPRAPRPVRPSVPPSAPAMAPILPRAAALLPAPALPEDIAPEQQPLLLDTYAAERIESMRKGIEQAVDEAREILALLAPTSPPRSPL
ncbi:MAG TPA: MerR family transcriptional regulator [Thermoanaerobaculia bacterium]|jgi:DNA-binding transcriptional MerR regulator|nr:MerR family transcriptional regulator [Thermoanaerobaculia bacterium]